MEDKVLQIKKWLGTGSINVFGIQFSGKDTVGKRLANTLSAEFLSSGDIVRAARENAENDNIKRAAKLSDSGVLTPTEEFKELIVPYLYDARLSGKPLILSTVGRWIGEEVPVLEALNRGHHATKAVVLLNISEDEVWRRWQIARNTRNGGRADDMDEEKVARRISEYNAKTLPVIEVYRRMGILLEIDGEQDRDKVFSDLINILDKFSKSS